MLSTIIHFSIRNKGIIGLMTLALVVWGIGSATKLPVDAVPDFTNNQVQIITITPTLASQEVEQFVTYPVKQAMTKRAIKTVEKNLIEGALIVIFVLVLFLGNFRAGLIVASAIPLLHCLTQSI